MDKISINTKFRFSPMGNDDAKPWDDGAVTFPIFQTAIFKHQGETEYHELGYTRLNNNPTLQVLSKELAFIESGEKAILMSSGMAAITTTLLTVLQSGDHLLIQRGVYGGTYGLLRDLFPKLGIEFDFFDATDSSVLDKKIKPNTKMIYVEGMTNPLLEIADHESVVEFCKAKNLTSIIDNTFLSPVNFQPLQLGYDIVIHSGTKYLNGHQDIIAGVVISSEERINSISLLSNHIGAVLDPHVCFLFSRGLKTLELRMEKHNNSSLQIARFLDKHPAVEAVHYPGLQTHPQHERAKKLFKGYGGMIIFEIKGGEDSANKFIDASKIATHAVSLGGIDTLVIKPAGTTHASVSEADKKEINLNQGLIRISVGIEKTSKLIEDFDQALKSIL